MIRRNDIFSALRAQPFKPFRIHLSSGRSYDVRHPKLAWVMTNTVMVFLVKEYQGLNYADDYALVSILQITDLEPIADSSAPPSAGSEQNVPA